MSRCDYDPHHIRENNENEYENIYVLFKLFCRKQEKNFLKWLKCRKLKLTKENL